MPSDAEAEASVKFNTSGAVGNTNRRMVDAEKKAGLGVPLPIRRHPAAWKFQQFQRMTVGIAEFERRDTARGGRQLLRPVGRDCDPPIGGNQPLISCMDVRNDDRKMLKAKI